MDMMKKIPLPQSRFALVDNDIFDQVSEFNWHVDGRGYVKSSLSHQKGSKWGTVHKAKALHHVVMPPKIGVEIDHINCNKLDNQRKNLRYVTRSINIMNGSRRSTNKSGHRGVCSWWRDGGWRAYAVVNGKQIHLGYFKELDEAIKARKQFEKESGVTP